MRLQHLSFVFLFFFLRTRNRKNSKKNILYERIHYRNDNIIQTTRIFILFSFQMTEFFSVIDGRVFLFHY